MAKESNKERALTLEAIRVLDAIDRALVAELIRDGRITNAALAARVGIDGLRASFGL